MYSFFYFFITSILHVRREAVVTLFIGTGKEVFRCVRRRKLCICDRVNKSINEGVKSWQNYTSNAAGGIVVLVVNMSALYCIKKWRKLKV